jgi:hypothetical protein
MTSKRKVIANDEIRNTSMRKEVVMAYLKFLHQHLHEEAEEHQLG